MVEAVEIKTKIVRKKRVKINVLSRGILLDFMVKSVFYFRSSVYLCVVY